MIVLKKYRKINLKFKEVKSDEVETTVKSQTNAITTRKPHYIFIKMTLSSRRSLRHGVGGTNNLFLSTNTDNISREKNKQTTHLKIRSSFSRTFPAKPNLLTEVETQKSTVAM